MLPVLVTVNVPVSVPGSEAVASVGVMVPPLSQVRKTQIKTVHTLHLGGFTAHETLLECGHCQKDTICHFHFLRDMGKDLLESDYDAIRQRWRQQALTHKLLHHARRLKTTLDQQAGWIESFCHSVQADALPAEQFKAFPLLCAYSPIPWALEGRTGALSSRGYGPGSRVPVESLSKNRVRAPFLPGRLLGGDAASPFLGWQVPCSGGRGWDDHGRNNR